MLHKYKGRLILCFLVCCCLIGILYFTRSTTPTVEVVDSDGNVVQVKEREFKEEILMLQDRIEDETPLDTAMVALYYSDTMDGIFCASVLIDDSKLSEDEKAEVAAQVSDIILTADLGVENVAISGLSSDLLEQSLT